MRVNDKHSNWDEPEVLDAALLAYRTAPIDGMTVTPYEVMFGREPNMPIDNVLADEADQENEQGSKRRRLMTPEEYCDIAHEKRKVSTTKFASCRASASRGTSAKTRKHARSPSTRRARSFS